MPVWLPGSISYRVMTSCIALGTPRGAQAITLRRGGRGNETVGLTEHDGDILIRTTKFPRRRVDAHSAVAWDSRCTFPRHYVPAFAERETARRVACWLPAIPQMRLERFHVEHGHASDHCCLRVVKAREETLWRCAFTLHEMPLADALLIPVNANVGLLLASDLLCEDDNEMLFACRVVEPVDFGNSMLAEEGGRLEF